MAEGYWGDADPPPHEVTQTTIIPGIVHVEGGVFLRKDSRTSWRLRSEDEDGQECEGITLTREEWVKVVQTIMDEEIKQKLEEHNG